VASNRARVLFGKLNLGEVVAKVAREEVRFIPVESVDVNQPAANKGEDSPKLSPISSDNVPLSISTVTYVPR
jgi:hypothetical protein